MPKTLSVSWVITLVLLLPNGRVLRGDEADESLTYLDQGWSEEIRELFYFTPQGSRMMPVKWFTAIETKDGERFADPKNLERYGFLPVAGPTRLNPYGWPIGFAVDPQPIPGRGLSVGFTCAACHTGDVTVEGKRIRIDGAPSALDFDTFYSNLAAAVHHTNFNPEAFQRFAKRVLREPTELTIAQLRIELADFEAALAGDATMRAPTLQSGIGRVDALTQIVNALAVVDQREPRNLVKVNAPTSYPHLWLAPQLEFVQWNPIAASPIARNGGEALGVFGEAKLYGPETERYQSSLLLRQLHNLEKWVNDLKPPKWDPDLFGAVDETKAAAGRELYMRHCASCHTAPPYERTDPAENLFGKTFIRIGRVDYRKTGTDPLYVESLLHRIVRTNEATMEANDGRRLVPAIEFFLNAVSPVVQRSMNDLGLNAEERMAMNGFRLRPPVVPGGQPVPYIPPSFSDLKAGPLAGIWATAPYLHNGSVPTIYDLLSPEAERPKVFFVGSRELDRQKLGLVSENAPGRFRFDTSLPGNRNIGHVYPPEGLSEDERYAIIEFLKTL